jgi:hypothetical protein
MLKHLVWPAAFKRRGAQLGWWMLAVLVSLTIFRQLGPYVKASLCVIALVWALLVFVPPSYVSRLMATLRGTKHEEPQSSEHARVVDRGYPMTLKLVAAGLAALSLWVVIQGVKLTLASHPWVVLLNAAVVIAAAGAYIYDVPTRPRGRKTTSGRRRLPKKRSVPNTIESLTASAMDASLRQYAERQQAELAERRDRARLLE